MKKIVISLVLFAAVMSVKAKDPYDSYPFQLSLFPPVCIFEEDVQITGLKINLIYGYNTYVSGFDLGLIGGAVDTEGLQLNVVNYAEQDGGGIRIGALNIEDSCEGLEIGLINYAQTESKGLKFGIINVATESVGLQFGLVNYTRYMKGFQIGLINVIAESRCPFLPIFNAYF